MVGKELQGCASSRIFNDHFVSRLYICRRCKSELGGQMKQLEAYLLCNRLFTCTTRVEVKQSSIDTILLQYPQGFRNKIVYIGGLMPVCSVCNDPMCSLGCEQVKILHRPPSTFQSVTRRILPKPRVPIPPTPRYSISFIPAFTTSSGWFHVSPSEGPSLSL